jgi:hypothetical protein
MENRERILNISRDELTGWLLLQFERLSKDIDQRIVSDQMEHLCTRTQEILWDYYRGIDIGTLKEVFQNGIAGQYGGGSKLTVQNILFWLKGFYRARITANAINKEMDDDLQPKRYYDEVFDRSGEFVIWMNRNNVDYPETFPPVKGRCSPDFIRYRDLYHEYKAMRRLKEFKSQLVERKGIIIL